MKYTHIYYDIIMDIFSILSNINKTEEKKTINILVVKELIQEYEIKNIRKTVKNKKNKNLNKDTIIKPYNYSL
jgi:hypothetical protein